MLWLWILDQYSSSTSVGAEVILLSQLKETPTFSCQSYFIVEDLHHSPRTALVQEAQHMTSNIALSDHAMYFFRFLGITTRNRYFYKLPYETTEA